MPEGVKKAANSDMATSTTETRSTRSLEPDGTRDDGPERVRIVAPRPGLVVELPYRWRRETYSTVRDWKTLSQALLSALPFVMGGLKSANGRLRRETTA